MSLPRLNDPLLKIGKSQDTIWYGINISDLSKVPGIEIIASFLLPPRQEGSIVLTGPNIDDNYIFWYMDREKADGIDFVLKTKSPGIRTVMRKQPPKLYKSRVAGVKDDADTILARELVLFATNDYDIYRQRIQPFIKNYARKIKAGTWDRDKGIQGLANNLAKDVQKAYWWTVLRSRTPPTMNRATKLVFGEELLEEIMPAIQDLAVGKADKKKGVQVLLDGEVVAEVESYEEAYVWLHANQPQSVDYALKYGGYEIRV